MVTTNIFRQVSGYQNIIKQTFQSAQYIVILVVVRTFTDKSAVSNKLNIMIETLACEAAVAYVVITLLTVVLRVLVNHVGFVVFVFSYVSVNKGQRSSVGFTEDGSTLTVIC